MDATQAQTDVASFAVLEPMADGFRNHVRKGLEGSAAPPSSIRPMMRNIAGVAAISASAPATIQSRGASLMTSIAAAQAPRQRCVPKEGRIDHGSPATGNAGVASE